MAFDDPAALKDEQPRHPGGRGTTYKPEYCQMAIEWGAAGKSRTWIAAKLGTSRAGLDDWSQANQEFSYALTRAKALEQMWWEDAGQEHLTTAGFSSGTWSRSMSARFPHEWREKTAVVGGDKDDNPIRQEHTHRNIDAVLSRVSGIAARIGADRDAQGTDGD